MNLTEQANKVREWHGHHTAEYMKNDLCCDDECQLYNAIQSGMPDGELVMLALEVDPDCVET